MDKFAAELRERMLVARVEALERLIIELFPDAQTRLQEIVMEVSMPKTERLP